MNNEEIKAKLIEAGVRNLSEFGYKLCNEENIMSDVFYSMMFKNMLIENKGMSAKIDSAINELIETINKNES